VNVQCRTGGPNITWRALEAHNEDLFQGKEVSGLWFGPPCLPCSLPKATVLAHEKTDLDLMSLSKEFKTMFVLDLMENTYYNQTTRDTPLLDGQPDQIERLFDPVNDKESVLYFTQDGGRYAGISAMNSAGQCFTVLEGRGEYSDETTGLAFSPEGFHIYFAFQDEGVLFDVTRIDGLPFHAQTLDIKYHNVLARRLNGWRST